MIKTFMSWFKKKPKETYGFSCGPDVKIDDQTAQDIIEGATYVNSIKYSFAGTAGRFEFVGHEHAGKDKPIIYVMRHMRTGICLRVEAELFSQIFQPSKKQSS